MKYPKEVVSENLDSNLPFPISLYKVKPSPKEIEKNPKAEKTSPNINAYEMEVEYSSFFFRLLALIYL